MTVDQIEIIERLRHAAKENGEVASLLCVLSRSLLIDGAGNKELVGDAKDIEYLKAAILACHFSEYDRREDK